jgi:hypothetical protein
LLTNLTGGWFSIILAGCSKGFHTTRNCIV